jgi:hypothetical protein
MDYRTGCHVDKKNVAGSLSALVILETGEPYQGGQYMLPQFRLGLSAKQGTVIFHRSDHKEKGFVFAYTYILRFMHCLDPFFSVPR